MQNIGANLEKAEKIFSLALTVKDLRDRADVIDRAIEIYQDLGKDQRATELTAELDQLTASKTMSPYQMPAPSRADHIGRNEPCPCGSGKKYKKCCGQ